MKEHRSSRRLPSVYPTTVPSPCPGAPAGLAGSSRCSLVSHKFPADTPDEATSSPATPSHGLCVLCHCPRGHLCLSRPVSTPCELYNPVLISLFGVAILSVSPTRVTSHMAQLGSLGQGLGLTRAVPGACSPPGRYFSLIWETASIGWPLPAATDRGTKMTPTHACLLV